MKLNNRKGFTLIEVIVVAAIIAILAGILVPMIFNQIDESRVAKARGDIKTIQSAIMMFRKDNSAFPNRENGADPATNTVQLLNSDGKQLNDGTQPPEVSAAFAAKGWGGLSYNMLNFLRTNGNGYPASMWKGPYLSEANGDPWGNTYIVGAKNFDDTTGKPVWILSAGPNQIVETNIDDDALCGGATPCDDIGVRIK